jgi:hypothetical protein
VTVIVPVVVIVPGTYVASVAAMVSVPSLKSVAAAVTVHAALANARASVTLTTPIGALMVVPGAPEPRLAETGTETLSPPAADAREADMPTNPAAITSVAAIALILITPPRYRSGPL